ncbi:MAG: tRNA (guanosine(37)-N1)-methyltransferase TrmD [Lachnospiraceae bacterium]|nr:tRNA (guanosine(37)-N1)-methyltransferase TrmD [Lachnospiraceae bacterium]
MSETLLSFTVLTLFTDMIKQNMNTSIMGRALEKGIIGLDVIDIRDYSCNKHNRVDDYPYGGGAGMLMEAEPVYKACEAAKSLHPGRKKRLIYLSPIGRTFTQDIAKELSTEENLIFLCGHYEGIDERVLENEVDDYISLGDFVLTGGEIPALAIMDAVARLIPGVLNNDESAGEESFENGLLEYPQYTRPELFLDRQVPEVLLSGHHENIRLWRFAQSLIRTNRYRPDMLKGYILTDDRKKQLKKFIKTDILSENEKILLSEALKSIG